MSLWGAAIGCMGTLAWAGSALGVAHVLNLLAFVVLVGLWATLQFGTIYRDGADIARFLERCDRRRVGRGRNRHTCRITRLCVLYVQLNRYIIPRPQVVESIL